MKARRKKGSDFKLREKWPATTTVQPILEEAGVVDVVVEEV